MLALLLGLGSPFRDGRSKKRASRRATKRSKNRLFTQHTLKDVGNM